jgi:hypothetical protein
MNLPDEFVVSLAFLENADHLVVVVCFNSELAADGLVTLVRYFKSIQVNTRQEQVFQYQIIYFIIPYSHCAVDIGSSLPDPNPTPLLCLVDSNHN